MWACQVKVGSPGVRRIKEEFASISADMLTSRRENSSLGAQAFSSVLFSKSFADSHLLRILFSAPPHTRYLLLDLSDLDHEHSVTPGFTSAAKHNSQIPFSLKNSKYKPFSLVPTHHSGNVLPIKPTDQSWENPNTDEYSRSSVIPNSHTKCTNNSNQHPGLQSSNTELPKAARMCWMLPL